MPINLSDIPKRISKEEAIERIMRGLKVDREEAEEVYAYDQEVEHDPHVGQLEPEKEVIARKMAHTGTREKKAPMVPNLTKRERKPNATKGGVVSEIAAFLEKDSEFEIKHLQVPNKEGKISFMIGDKWYTWALTEHRKKPAWAEEVSAE